jgi:hypothetical protein
MKRLPWETFQHFQTEHTPFGIIKFQVEFILSLPGSNAGSEYYVAQRQNRLRVDKVTAMINV